MSTSASPFAPSVAEPRARALSAEGGSLAAIEPGGEVCVTAVILETDLAAWVKAVGICEGERLTVLRRAAFGGPIHVRAQSGGEFALARSVAPSVLVRALATP
jgi:ferrous iron transport protein A